MNTNVDTETESVNRTLARATLMAHAFFGGDVRADEGADATAGRVV